MSNFSILGKMSIIGRIKVGLATMGMSIIGLAAAVVTAIIAFIGGITMMFGSDKLVDLYDTAINTIVCTVNGKFEEVIEKIMEDEEVDLEE